MSICRTCLARRDLIHIFPDDNLVALRSKQLYDATGIVIKPNDGLSQVICMSCAKQINETLNLRDISFKTDQILKKIIKIDIDEDILPLWKDPTSIIVPDTNIICDAQIPDMNINSDIKDIQISNGNLETSKNDNFFNDTEISHSEVNIDEKYIDMSDTVESDFYVCDDSKVLYQDKYSSQDVLDSKSACSIRISDFESNDESFSSDIVLEELEIDSEEENKVAIEDFESSDSEVQRVYNNSEVGKANKDDTSDSFKFNLNEKETEFVREKRVLKRENKKKEQKEIDEKLMTMAVIPYDPKGPIRCKLCHKRLMNICTFKTHAKTHFELQHACEVCGKKFIDISHVRYHQQRVHGQMKRLACESCSYRAVDPQQLQNHVRAVHTGERPFVCDVCGGSFRMRRDIAQHMRRHFGLKNIQCERCPAMFRSRSDLTSHQSRVHENITNTYNCYLCSEKYKKRCSVRKHIAKIHGVPRNQQQPIEGVTTRRNSVVDAATKATNCDTRIESIGPVVMKQT